MKLPRIRLELPAPEDLRILTERAEALARESAAAEASSEGALYVCFASAGMRLCVGEPRVVRMVPRIGTLHPVPGADLALAWSEMRPLVVLDLAEAFGARRDEAAVSASPGLILRSSPGVVVAVSGPLDLLEGTVAQQADRGAWPAGQAGLAGQLEDGAFVLAESWLEQWVRARAGEG